ncbi:HDIG domain-containing protein [Enterococcus sp. MJM12]|uniref:HDIG domain-containing protein n=1 Tax=Candidatus Enterococcus myersii TaxID=2815322 RepID=A0ABS3H626_9ENTE|nr:MULTISPECIES: HDIG domain-containing metalloprotein [unclassified Enterococcus]MBO0448910.1 HDIG domain-containing protein [Enterococcus sp. MJM12]MCD1023640.1 HDIG domain-containing protein [Enterococcus sp. SMC-9]
MIIEPLRKIRERLGRFYIPLILLVFFISCFGLLFTSVKQKSVDYHEGQVASESIRANKTVENKAATDQKRQLAAEAVVPEYTYQEDISETQHSRIETIFNLIAQVKKSVDDEHEQRQKQAKDKEIPAVTTEDYIASLKKSFEKVNDEDVQFYQAIPASFYEIAFTLNSAALNTVRDNSLNILAEQMKNQVRESNLADFKNNAENEVDALAISSMAKDAMKELLKNAIVVNDFPNEKKTEELKEQARASVAPVMIIQGEVIVREGSQIDASAIQKLQLLGLTSQNTSFFPIVAMVAGIIVQILVLLYFARQYADKNKRQEFLTFYTLAMITSIAMMKFFQLFQTELLPYIPLFFPAAFVPLVLNIFVNRRAGIIAAMFQVIAAVFCYYDALGTNLLTIVLLTYLFSGLMGAIVRRERISKQGFSAVMWLIVFPFLLNIVLVVFQGLTLTDARTWTTIICGLAGTLLSFLLTMGLHQYIELLVTDNSVIVLNELSNPNHPLLKKLLEEAPGTYHHSMMVANLSANAVALIGGHSLLTRVACYYHDIGKLKHANFFVENLPAGAENPHNFLLPEDSKQIIFGHVTDGAKVLKEYKMPKMVIDICYQHHGTTLMKYFYAKAKERNPEVTEAEFRYPGPKPQTKEAGVVNIADSCEAAVRAMDHPTNEKIRQFVHNLIVDRILDGQLDDSGLTLKEIHIIEDSLVNGLCSTFHSRIKYPKMKSEAEKMKEEQERSDK